MTTLDDRGAGFERKFALDQETAFKVQGRRDRLAGEWAGGLLGLSGPALDDYVRSVIRADLSQVGDDDVVRRLVADLAGKADEREIRSRLDAFHQQARAAVEAGA